jgi:adenine-specific DNA-methyltransferase
MIEILNIDCRNLNTLKQADLIFCDPPFGIGQKYAGFEDKIQDYREFTFQWMQIAGTALKENGVLVAHGSDEVAEHFIHCYEQAYLKRIGTIIRSYRFGQCRKSHWVNGHEIEYIFQRRDAKDFKFNWEAVAEESDRVKYKDKRVANGVNGKRPPLTVWDFPRITGNSKERRPNHPNQIPEELVARYIKAYTDEGDMVMDFFGGSFTTAVVCQTLNRNCISCDISLENCKSGLERLKIGTINV